MIVKKRACTRVSTGSLFVFLKFVKKQQIAINQINLTPPYSSKTV